MSVRYGAESVATLRALVTVIDRELAGAIAPPASLRIAWAQMVDVLSLGQAPERRECPICGAIGMHAHWRSIRRPRALAPAPRAALRRRRAGVRLPRLAAWSRARIPRPVR